MTALRLAPDQLVLLADLVAERVVEALNGRQGEGELVDAQTLARQLAISRETVYEHAAALGAIRVGNGPKPRLRFDVDQARAAWTRRVAGENSDEPEAVADAPTLRRPRPSAAQHHDDLLPVKPPKGRT
jgi:hypothetical protein